MENQNKIGLAIRILSNQVEREFERHIACSLPNGITGLQGRVIDFVKEQTDEVFQKDIEEEYGIQRSTATGMLQLMEKNGLLTREAVDYDARLKKIVLTKKAIGIHARIKDEINRVENMLREGQTEDEINTFFSVMKKISMKVK